MKRSITLLAATPLLVAGAGVGAEETSPHSFSANATITSDYIFRGETQSNEQPAVQGGFDWEHASGLYAGVWASSLEFNENKGSATPVDEATIELDLYGGYAGEFTNGIGWDVGLLYYAYPGSDDSLDYDFLEVYGGLSYTFQNTPLEPTFGFQLSYSPDYFGAGTDDSVYGDASLDLSLPYEFGLGLHVGALDVDGANEFVDWKVGLSKSLVGFDLELAYFDTDDADNDARDSRLVFSISRSF